MNIIGNSLWEIVRQVDVITLLILGILLVMSVMCWALALYKIMMIRIKKKQTQHALSLINNIHSWEDIKRSAPQMVDTLSGRIVRHGTSLIQSWVENRSVNMNLSEKEFELLHLSVEQEFSTIMHHEEEYLSVISTSAAASPLIGLFGTVWGLIHSFLRISAQQSADIATVAPGIAEALITTLAGLVVAIPALILFHYIQGQIRALEYSLLACADKFLWTIRKSMV